MAHYSLVVEELADVAAVVDYSTAAAVELEELNDLLGLSLRIESNIVEEPAVVESRLVAAVVHELYTGVGVVVAWVAAELAVRRLWTMLETVVLHRAAWRSWAKTL